MTLSAVKKDQPASTWFEYYRVAYGTHVTHPGVRSFVSQRSEEGQKTDGRPNFLPFVHPPSSFSPFFFTLQLRCPKTLSSIFSLSPLFHFSSFHLFSTGSCIKLFLSFFTFYFRFLSLEPGLLCNSTFVLLFYLPTGSRASTTVTTPTTTTLETFPHS